MLGHFFPYELVIVGDGFNFEYANVASVDENDTPSLSLRHDSQMSEDSIKIISHVAIAPITLGDLGFYYMNEALLDQYNGPCYHCNLNNGFNAKVAMISGKWQLAKEAVPGALEKFVVVDTIGDIQMNLGTWHNAPCIIDANRIGCSGPRLLHENTWLDQEINKLLSDDLQKKHSACAGLTRYLSQCVYNLDQCRFWLSEYYIEMYRQSNDKSQLIKSRMFLQTSISGGYCEHYRQRLAWVESELSK